MSEIKGELIVKGQTEEVGTSGFKKRSAVVKPESQYPQTILVEFVKDKCDLLDSVNIGDKVTINYNLNGRKWTSPQGEDKYFNSVQGWKVTVDSNSPAPTESVSQDPPF